MSAVCAAGCGTPVPLGKRGHPRKWCSDRCRKNQYRLPCLDCGAPCNPRANCNGQHCSACARRISGEKGKARGDAIRAEVAALWSEGLTMREINAAMGWKAHSAQARIADYRTRGFRDEFPLRHRVSDAGRRRMSEAAKRTRAAERAKVEQRREREARDRRSA